MCCRFVTESSYFGLKSLLHRWDFWYLSSWLDKLKLGCHMLWLRIHFDNLGNKFRIFLNFFCLIVGCLQNWLGFWYPWCCCGYTTRKYWWIFWLIFYFILNFVEKFISCHLLFNLYFYFRTSLTNIVNKLTSHTVWAISECTVFFTKFGLK